MRESQETHTYRHPNPITQTINPPSIPSSEETFTTKPRAAAYLIPLAFYPAWRAKSIFRFRTRGENLLIYTLLYRNISRIPYWEVEINTVYSKVVHHIFYIPIKHIPFHSISEISMIFSVRVK